MIACLCLFAIFGTYSYVRDLRYAQIKLDSKILQIARRLSGELLIAPRGSPEAVLAQVANELGVSDAGYGEPDKMLKIYRKDKIIGEVAVPFLEDRFVVRGSISKPQIFEYFNFAILLGSFLLVGFIVGLGLYLQSRYLRRHLVRPIQSLVEISTGDKLPSIHWPQEIQDISLKLSDSFQDRERAVYSQIARGVVHDIKTLLQSFKVAADLTKESPTEARIKNFVNVSTSKLPTLLALIDNTLDGSREITPALKQSSLTDTVSRSIETAKSLGISPATQIQFEKPDADILINHDPLQLERVFTNLLKNGLEAIAESDAANGILKISFELKEKEFVGVTIEDSGKGLPNPTNSVFRSLRSTKAHGSGLGLLVSRKIVEAHNGQISASNSSTLKGARFMVQLPHEASV